ncbi:MAG: hypothetical protein ACRDE2_07775, partial [Chitinophagaceae bacterium]
MGKNKKGKIMSMPSTPEGYFKSGMARKLPIYECLINKEWADQGLATIMISRKHINENLSWAIFLVDIYCLGVKDCFNRFNLPEVEYLEEKNIASDQFGMALI